MAIGDGHKQPSAPWIARGVSLRTTIFCSFGLFLAFSIMIGIFAIDRIGTINAMNRAVANEIDGMTLLARMKELSQELRAVDVFIHNAYSETSRHDYIVEKQQAQEAFSATWIAYAPRIAGPEEQVLAHQLRQAWQHFLAVEGEASTLDRGGETSLADGVFAGPFRSDSLTFGTAVSAVLDLRTKRLALATSNAESVGIQSRDAVMVALGIVALLTLVASWGIARRISAPIAAITGSMRSLADGDLAIAIPGGGRGDEIGAMAAAVRVFKDNALHARALEQEQSEARAHRTVEDDRIRSQAAQKAAADAAALVVSSIGAGLERLAAGDLTYRLDRALPEAYETLRADLNDAFAQLKDLVRSIVLNSSEISSGTTEITRSADELSRRTEQQAASLEETAAAMDQITSAVHKTAESARQAHDIVAKTQADAELAGTVMRKAMTAMEGIKASSGQIEQIVSVIDEIAFQTNLLALNAGVEAARAGDSGRGFAVVASEVRALAQRSAEAAREIKSLIATSVQQVGFGVALVGDTGEALDRIVGQVNAITRAVSDIAGSAQDQAAGLHDVNTAIRQMDKVTQQNAAMVEESAAASHGLAREASALVTLTDRFQTGDSAQRAKPGATAPLRRLAKAAGAHR